MQRHMPNIWSYMFTTADPAILAGMLADDSSAGANDFATDSPLAGLGYGIAVLACAFLFWKGY